MALLRRVLGEALRSRRLRQRRTLREVSGTARVSLGYLSEIERGQKEASSELLAAICAALGVRLSDLLREVSDSMVRTETPVAPVAPVRRVPAVPHRELVGVGSRSGAPMPPVPRLPAPSQDVPDERDRTWELVRADGPVEAGALTGPVGPPGRPLDPIGTEQAMLERLGADPFRAGAVGELPGPTPGTALFDGGVVCLPARGSVVAAA